jgi:hypothetical protein
MRWSALLKMQGLASLNNQEFGQPRASTSEGKAAGGEDWAGVVDCHYGGLLFFGEEDADGGGAGGVEGAGAEVDEGAAHSAFAGPGEGAVHGGEALTAVDGEVDLLAGAGAEGIGSGEGGEIAVGEGNGRGGVGVAQGLEEIEDGAGGFAAGFCVREEADSVRAAKALDVRLRGEEGFDEIELAEHGGGKKRGDGTVGKQVFGDGAIAHVGCSAESGFPIAEAPVPGGTGEGGAGIDEFADAVEIEVGDGDHFADQFGGLGGKSVADGRDEIFVGLRFEGEKGGGESHCGNDGGDKL